MGETICRDARVGIRKSLFGLKTTAVYKPTESVIDVRNREYAPTDGKRLKQIMETPREQMAEATKDFCPVHTPNSNYMAEICTSRDGNFAAIQLLQFSNLIYQPVTPVCIYEGEEAKWVAKLI